MLSQSLRYICASGGHAPAHDCEYGPRCNPFCAKGKQRRHKANARLFKWPIPAYKAHVSAHSVPVLASRGRLQHHAHVSATEHEPQ